MSFIQVIGDTTTFNTTTSGLATYDISGCQKIMAQMQVTVTGASKEANLEYYKSNDGVNWTLIETANNITTTEEDRYEKNNPTWKFIKIALDVVGGGADVTRSVVGIGPS